MFVSRLLGDAIAIGAQECIEYLGERINGQGVTSSVIVGTTSQIPVHTLGRTFQCQLWQQW